MTENAVIKHAFTPQTRIIREHTKDGFLNTDYLCSSSTKKTEELENTKQL